MVTNMVVAVDILILKGTNILVVRRELTSTAYPGYWALPGGVVELNETIEQAAYRELREETNLDLEDGSLRFYGYFDSLNRDPRGRAISFVFYHELNEDTEIELNAGDDAIEVEWIDIITDECDKLAFDHADIVSAVLAKIW